MTAGGPPDPLLSDHRYLPYLPLIYVAWADGSLTREELERLRALASERFAPGIDALPVLAGWLDPAAPPSAARLAALLRRVRAATRGLDPELRRDLAQLGAALADAEAAPLLPRVARAIEELEGALGVGGVEAARALLAPTPAPVTTARRPPRLDAAALGRMLDGRYRPARERIRALLTAGGFERPIAIDGDAYRRLVFEWLGRLAEAGVGALAYPEVTGAAEDLGDFIASFEALADFDLSLVIKGGVHFGLFGGSLYFLGTERHRALLPAVARAELLGCFAMTETGHGSNVRQLGTTATLDGGEWVIHTPTPAARKDYIGNAACHAHVAVVFAQMVLGDEQMGVHAFLVPIRADGAPAPGVTIGDCGPKMGLNGVDNGRLTFDRVRVPREALLDRYAEVDAAGTYASPINSPTRRFFTMIGALVAGRISIACAGVAAARGALTIAIRYGARRRQFGPAGRPEVALLDYRTHQRRLMIPLAEAYALTFALRALTDDYLTRDEDTTQEVEARAAALKATATWYTTATIQACREACGGAGYLAENRFAALKADTDVFTTFEGDNTVLMLLAAKGALTAFRDSLGDERLFGVLRHLRDRAAAQLTEFDPVTPRRTDPAHLRDPDFQLDALRHREEKLTWSAAGRIRRRVADGMDSFDAVNDCADHLQALGRAMAEREVAERFTAAVAAVEDPALRAALTRLRDLYALARIEADQGWFLRHGVLEAGKARAIRDAIHALCAEVREDALDLVDGFSIPEALLGAPIAS